jgi:hypothetical protein
MNIVESVKEQLSGEALNRLSSFLGENEATTRSAVGATVPSLLSALAGLTNTSEGARRLASALSNFQAGSGAPVSGQPGQLLEQGTSLLNSLFSGSNVSSIVSALSRYTGIGMSAVKNLVGYLAPIAMGTIASKFAGRSISPDGLKNFFSDQRSNIADAMPSGLSLAETARPAPAPSRPTYPTGQRPVEEPNYLKWLLPLAALAAVLATLFWWGSRPRTTTVPTTHPPESGYVEPPPPVAQPPVAQPRVTLPDATTLSRDLTGTYQSLTDALGQVKDVASAENALPTLRNLSAKLDTLKSYWDKLPEGGRAFLRSVTNQRLGSFKDEVSRVLAIPGVGNILKPVLDGIVAKLNEFGG